MTRPFHLDVAQSPGAFVVRSFRAHERMSECYAIDLDVVGTFAGAPPRLLGRRIRLDVVGDPSGPRTFHGLISAVENRGSDVQGRTALGMKVEPRFALLAHSRRKRIFHDQTSLETAQQILDEHRVRHRLRVASELPKRAHRIQFDESDLAFVERILFEEGIFYSFDHPRAGGDGDTTSMGETEILVLCDTASYYPKVEPISGFHHRAAHGEGLASAADAVFSVFRSERTRTIATMVRGVDFQRPAAHVVSTHDRVHADAPGTAEVKALAARPHLTVDEFTSSYEAQPVQPWRADRLLEHLRADAIEIRGCSASPYLMPGRVLTIDEHDDAEVNGDHVLVEVIHQGVDPLEHVGTDVPRTYDVEFVAAPAQVPLRPARRPRPRVDGAELATVVGPPGQEIHTDEHGRVRVQFPWDLEGTFDPGSSAWLRVAQSWSGAGFGAQFLPRVGMEVLVDFIGGDVDRPYVAGTLHNGVAPPPFRFPEERTMSGFRSRSSPGGASGNEIIMDDARDVERVAVRSIRLLELQSTEDTAQRVGRNHHRTIGGTAVDDIAGTLDQHVGGVTSQRFAADRTVETGGDETRLVAGDTFERRHGNVDRRIDGDVTEQLGASFTRLVGSGRQTPDALELTSVNGASRTQAVDRIDLIAGREILFQVGRSRLTMTAEGVSIETPSLDLPVDRLSYASKGGTGCVFTDSIVLKANEIKLISAGASLVLDSEAKLDGAFVKLNCGGSSASASQKLGRGEEGVATFRLVNYDPARHAGAQMRVQGPDGVIERPVDGEGKARFEGKKGDTFVLQAVVVDGVELPTEEVES